MKNFCKTISKRALLGFMLLFASLTVVAQEITVTPGLSAGSSSVLAEENGIYYCVVEANGKIEYQITPAAGDTIVSAKWTVYKDGEVFTELDAKTTFSLAIDEVAYYSLAATVQFKNGKENTTVEFSETELPQVRVIAPELVTDKEHYYPIRGIQNQFAVQFVSNLGFGSWTASWSRKAISSGNITAINPTVSGRSYIFSNIYSGAYDEYIINYSFNIGGVEMYSGTKTFLVTSVVRPELQAVSDTIFHTVEGGDYRFEVAASGGLDGAWSYSWYRNNELLEDELGTSITCTETPSGEKYEVVRYKVVAQNSCDVYNSSLNIVEKEFTIVEYQTPAFTYVTDSISNYLEGEEEIVHNMQADIIGGNPAGWHTAWKKNGEVFVNFPPYPNFSNTNEWGIKAGNIYCISQPNHSKGATSWAIAEDGDTLKSNVDLGIGLNAYDTRQQFAFIKNGMAYYLYHVAEGKYVNKQGHLTTEPVDPINFKAGAYENTVYMYFDSQHQINVGGSQQMIIDGWDTADGGNSCVLIEVGAMEPFDALCQCAAILYATGAVVEDVYEAIVTNTLENGVECFNQSKFFYVNKYLKTNIALTTDSIFYTSTEKDFDFGVSVDGGYSNGWEFKWTRNGEEIAGATAFNYTAHEVPGDTITENIYQVIATNRAENGDFLAEHTAEFTVVVYPALDINAKNDKRDFHKAEETDVTLSVDVAGGYSEGWTYQWYDKNGVEIADSINSSILVHVIPGAVAYTDNYKIVAVNSDVNGVELDRREESFAITVHPVTSIDYTTADKKFEYYTAVSDGFYFSIAVDGGYANGWTYKWTRNSEEIADATENNYTSSDEPCDTVAINRYVVTATNTAENGDFLAEQTLEFFVTTYPEAGITTQKSVFNTANDSTFVFRVETQGGYCDGWTYQWYDKNGVEIADATETSYTTNEAIADSYYYNSYKVVATNTAPDGKELAVRDMDFIVNIFPATSIDYATVNKKFEYYTARDTIFTLSVNIDGGCGDGWSFNWYKNDKKMSAYDALCDITETPAKSVVENTYKAVATNKSLDGEVLSVLEKEFFVTVYPKAGITTRKSVFNTANDSTFVFSVETPGGYSDGWTYQWSKNGVEIAGATETNYTTNEAIADSYYNNSYKVIATNTAPDSTVLDVLDMDFVVNIYPATSIDYATENKKFEYYTANDSTFTLSVTVDGGRESGWEYKWTKNGKDLSVNDDSYLAKESPAKVDEIKNYKVVATNRAENGEVMSVLEKNFKIEVFTKPEFIVPKDYHQQAVGDVSFERSVEISGANTKGWELVWRRNGELIDGYNGKKYNFTEENTNEGGYIDVLYTVEATNTYKNEILYNNTIEFPVRVYPSITFEYVTVPTTDSYDLYEETLDLGAIYDGGVVGDDEGKWTYEWTKNNVSLDCENSVFTHNVTNKTGEVINDVYNVVVKHFIGEDVVWKREYSYLTATYPSVAIKYETGMDTTICGGNELTFTMDFKYADAKGWTFEWTRDGKKLSEKTSSLTVLEENSSETVSNEHTYILTATNKHDGEVWFKEDYKFTSIIRPRLIIPEAMEYETMLREGDFIELGVVAGRGGDPTGWTYTWYNSHDGSYKITNQKGAALDEYVDVVNYGHQHKEMRTEYYMLHIKNQDRNSDIPVYYEQKYYYTVTIHRCPQEPLKLRRKGDGSSRIFIADMKETTGLDNDQLVANDYSFAFGYGDNEIVRDDYTLRYQMYTQAQAANTPWVYTYWEYEDGYVCKSDKVYLDSRAVSDEITEDVIVVDYNGFQASLQAPMSATVRVMTFNGSVVKVMSYDAQAEFDEKFDLDGLNGGFYLVEVCIGNNREVNKIFIKE